MVGGRQKTWISCNSYGTRVEQDQDPNYYCSLLRLSGHWNVRTDVSVSGPIPAEGQSSDQSFMAEHC